MFTNICHHAIKKRNEYFGLLDVSLFPCQKKKGKKMEEYVNLETPVFHSTSGTRKLINRV